ncbi:MAG: hypothetical protein EZS26_001100 [Candidatus Ordinivivax streblomastigis]|jgi:hypothetical protein|uniref:Lipoprotein n=1 Tax=Candidatus Ordinivivax streblomastigis TaxID=2540710 RepID=A0A5M8P2C0_9BACT|nr:MAG: hypothetical protein EZS26_001100 [Candidatus Ordinivivax streblomastigis]MDR2843906.1 hypothetical protein [Candidatus Symbiothrix sp.]
MKLYKLIALLAFVSIGFTACVSNEIEEDAVYTFSQTYKVAVSDMDKRVDPAGTYYEYEFFEPELTNYVYQKGILQAFLNYTKDSRKTLCPLPFSDFMIDDRGYQWEEQFTVEFQPKYIKFIQKISDHGDDQPVSDYYEFVVRFMW